MEDFSDNFYLTAEVFASCWKMRSTIMNYENYVKLIDSLQEQPLAPMSIEETMIRKRFDKQAGWNMIAYGISVLMLLTSAYASSIFTDFETRTLANRAWMPYDYSSYIVFATTYAYQAISLVVCSYLNVSCDSLFSGLLIHTCSELEILRHRLRHIKRNGDYTAKHCARLHNRIYKFAAMVNEQFKTTMFVQFVVSTSSLCMELYLLTQRDLDSKYIANVSFTSCVVLQILYYCWYGNEVRLKVPLHDNEFSFQL
ncbi:odorant receptor Or1-like [Colletes latitarsis]|uniref:odorant receptor Or1-like n=1 Tax=Colletes latitarsis TaxID=2605962 RepID=UPI0040365DD1